MRNGPPTYLNGPGDIDGVAPSPMEQLTSVP